MCGNIFLLISGGLFKETCATAVLVANKKFSQNRKVQQKKMFKENSC